MIYQMWGGRLENRSWLEEIGSEMLGAGQRGLEGADLASFVSFRKRSRASCLHNDEWHWGYPDSW